MKLRSIVLFLLLSVCLLYTNCSYAYTVDDFINFATQIKEQNSSFNKSTSQIIQYQDLLRQQVSGYNFTCFVCTNANWSQSFESTNLAFRVSPLKVNVSSDNVAIPSNYQNKSQWYTAYYYNNSWHIATSGQNWTNFNKSSSFGLLELDNQIVDNWYNNWFNGKYVPPYTGPVFTPSNSTINVYDNGVLVEVANGLPFGYVFPNVSTLGYLSDYNENFYGLDVNLSVVNAIDSDNFYSDNLASLNYNLYTGSNSNGLQFDFSSGKLSVTSTLLVPNQLYFLTIYYKDTYQDDWLYVGDKDFSFYSYFYTSPVSSGDAISPDLVKTLSPEIINSLREIGENNPNYPNIINNGLNLYSGDINVVDFPSGELVSGDFFGIDYHYYDNFGFGDFVYRFFYGLYYVLTDYNNVSMNFGILGTLNSGDFVINEPLLAGFVSLFSNCFLIICLVWFYYYFYKHISILDLDKVFKYDIDHLFDLF